MRVWCVVVSVRGRAALFLPALAAKRRQGAPGSPGCAGARKTALDLAPCGVRSFGYWRKVQVMSGSKVKGKKRGRSNKLPFVLMGGHICVDAAQGGLASVLPFLVIQSGFSYTEITALVLASNVASAVIQPLFGLMGDKKARPWLMSVGVALAGLGIALVGVLKSYWLVVLAAMVSGIGNAMLHPEGARLAYLAGGDDKAMSMSIFSVGGQIGFCLGPIISVAAVTAFGLSGTLVYLVLCLPYALVLLALSKRFLAFGVRGGGSLAGRGKRDRCGAFGVVLGALSVRSIVFYGVTSFFPLYLVATFNAAEDSASLLITVFSIFGAVATASAGFMSHRVPTPRLMVGCFVLMVASLASFLLSGSVWLCVAAVMVLARRGAGAGVSARASGHSVGAHLWRGGSCRRHRIAYARRAGRRRGPCVRHLGSGCARRGRPCALDRRRCDRAARCTERLASKSWRSSARGCAPEANLNLL